MERARQRRSKATANSEGIGQIERQRSVRKLASDSSYYGSGTTKEELFACELGRSSSKQVCRIPIKELVAEEMSKEIEPTRRRPSIIARLMGLDGLPPQQPLHRQCNGFSGSYRERTASVVSQRDGKPYESQEFKDVYEVLDAPRIDRGTYPAKGTVVPKFSSDEKLRNSKDFCDALDMLEEKEVLMEFLQQPDSLLKQHHISVQCDTAKSQCIHITVIKPSNSGKYGSSTIGLKSVKETLPCGTSCHRKHIDGPSIHSSYRHGAQKSFRSSKFQLEGKHETDIFPTRIVVLKPSLQKVQNVTKSVSSTCSSDGYLSDCMKHLENLNIGTEKEGPRVKRNSFYEADFPRVKSREFRETAKEITRRMKGSSSKEPGNLSSTFKGYPRDQRSYSASGSESREISKEITKRMKEGLDKGPKKLSPTFKGYAGDESSYYASGSESASEPEVAMLTSRKSFHWSNRQKPSSFHSIESSLRKEAKKRLSERLKISNSHQDVGAFCKGSSLGEMLAIPDWEMRPENLDPVVVVDESCDGFTGSDQIPDLDGRLGISSRDGWKDGRVKNPSRLTFVPSSVGCGGPKTSIQCENLDQNSCLIPEEATMQGRYRAIRGNLNNEGDSLSRNSSPGNKKFQHLCHTHRDYGEYLDEKQVEECETEINLGNEDTFQQKLVFEMAANNVNATDVDVEAKHEDSTVSSESPAELAPIPSPCLLGSGNFSTLVPDDSKEKDPQIGLSKEDLVLLPPVSEPLSPLSSRKADHPCPASVLEVPITEDASSSSECFKGVSAHLHELRMQLELLKMEAGASADGSIPVSSDDVGQESIAVSEENAIFEEDNWESSYISDVLIESGLNGDDLDTIMATCHSSERPLSSQLFDDIEKKYSEEATQLRSDRMLLFDRLNSALCEISQRFMDPESFLKQPMSKAVPSLQKPGIRYELRELLASEERKASGDAEETLDWEVQWEDLGSEIDLITELEKLLVDDLLAEVTNL